MQCAGAAERDGGELLFAFQRDDAWTSVGTAVAMVATDGQRILWQPSGTSAGAAAAQGTTSPPPLSAQQPGSRSRHGSTGHQDHDQELQQQQQQQQQQQAVSTTAGAKEVPWASTLPQRVKVQQRLPAQPPVRSDRASNGAEPPHIKVAQGSHNRAPPATHASAPKATDLSRAQRAPESKTWPDRVSASQQTASSVSQRQPGPLSASLPEPALLSGSSPNPAQPKAAQPSASPPGEGSEPPPDGTRTSGATRRDARQASGRAYVESIVAGAEVVWREAGLAGLGEHGGTPVVDAREPCIAAQKAAVAAAKVQHALILAGCGTDSVFMPRP